MAKIQSFTNSVDTKVTVGNTSTTVLAPDARRYYAVFTNDSNEVIYLARGDTAVLNTGIPLYPNGGTYEINNSNLHVGEVSAISTSGSKNLAISYTQS